MQCVMLGKFLNSLGTCIIYVEFSSFLKIKCTTHIQKLALIF